MQGDIRDSHFGGDYGFDSSRKSHPRKGTRRSGVFFPSNHPRAAVGVWFTSVEELKCRN